MGRFDVAEEETRPERFRVCGYYLFLESLTADERAEWDAVVTRVKDSANPQKRGMYQRLVDILAKVGVDLDASTISKHIRGVDKCRV